MIGYDTDWEWERVVWETSSPEHNIRYQTFKFVTNLLKVRICRSGKVIPPLPCSPAPFYNKNFSPYLKVFLPLNISVKKHRPPHGGEAIFQAVWIFNKEDGHSHTTVLCGTLLYRGNKSNSRAVSPHGVWDLQIGLQSDFLADISPPSIILLNYIYVSSWAGSFIMEQCKMFRQLLGIIEIELQTVTRGPRLTL